MYTYGSRGPGPLGSPLKYATACITYVLTTRGLNDNTFCVRVRDQYHWVSTFF